MEFRLSIILFLVTSTLFAQESVVSSGHYKFIENKGQWPQSVNFATEVDYGKIYFENQALTYDFMSQEDIDTFLSAHHSKSENPYIPEKIRAHSWKMKFIQSNESSPHGISQLPGAYSYFKGDPAKWASSCKSYSVLKWENLYNSIDLVVFSNDFMLKYDFVIHPNADPLQIRWHYPGIDQVDLVNGRLIIRSSVNEVIEQKPIAYQMIDGEKKLVACNYTVNNGELGFEFPEDYNTNHELIIDPELIFSSYTGSFSNNFGYTATYDDQGFLYSGSSAFGNQYPATTGAYEVNFQNGLVDMAITKWDSTGTALIWSSYLGGSNDELPHSLIVNSQRELFVYGTTSSLDFPTTPNAYDNTFNGGTGINLLQGLGVNYTNGSDIVVSRLSADGSDLLASTFVGGSDNDGLNSGTPLKYNYADEIRGEILIDDDNNIYIASSTNSDDFPVSANAIQPTYGGGVQEGCVFKLDNNLSTLLWSTYLGGSSNDAIYAVDLDAEQNVVVCGGTQSMDYPVTFGTIQQSNAGGIDGTISTLTPDGSTLINSTYWGTVDYDQIYFVELDSDNQIHVFGQTEADGDAYVINAQYGTPSSGQFISKFPPELNEVTWSTAFGSGSGVPNISPTAFLVDLCNKIYLSGWGSSIQGGGLTVSGMEVTPDAYQSSTDGNDFYLFVLEDDASDIFYGSFYGGTSSSEHVDGGTSRFDRKGVMYQAVCAGCGGNDDFPIEPNPGAYSPFNNANCNLGVFKFDFQIPVTIADFFAPETECVESTIAFENLSSVAQVFEWDFGDESGSDEFEPTHTYDLPGTYEVRLIASSPESCNQADTIFHTISILSNSTSTLASVEACSGEYIQIGTEPSSDPDISYEWNPSENLSNPEIANPIFNGENDQGYTLLISNGVCTDTLFQSVDVTFVDLEVPEDLVLCEEGEVIELSASSSSNQSQITWSFNADFSDPLNGPGEDDISLEITESTLLYVQAELDGCAVSETVEIDFLATSVELGGNEVICPGDSVELTVFSPNPELSYTWSPGEFILSGQNSESVWVRPDTPSFFTVSALNDENCEVSDSVLVDFSNLANQFLSAQAEPQVILSGESSQLSALPEGFDYIWSPFETLNNPSIQNPIATPSESTTYFVSVEDGNCVYSDSVRVQVVDFICGPPLVYIPNAFTPNGDDKNDVLYVRGRNLTRVDLKIYNRWGEKVFETVDQDEGWDGTYKGEPADPAVFVYYLEVDCGDGNTYFEKGNITLIR